jgi:hypothetical protein
VTGLEAGADEYLTKPVDQTSLVARVKSMLRVKELYDKVAAQASDLATWNKTLEQRVTDQLAQLERVGRLKRFLAPQVAELILNEGNERVLAEHRHDFFGLRGFGERREAAQVPKDDCDVAAMALETSLLSVLAVTRMMGINGRLASALSCLVASMPSSLGIITSSRIRSGRLWRATAIASSPSAACSMS